MCVCLCTIHGSQMSNGHTKSTLFYEYVEQIYKTGKDWLVLVFVYKNMKKL